MSEKDRLTANHKKKEPPSLNRMKVPFYLLILTLVDLLLFGRLFECSY